MNTNSDSKSKQPDRTRIARVIFAAAESMGISDRKLTERLISEVIERVEQFPPAPTLPGMEDLVAKQSRRQRRLPTDVEIEAMVKEILEIV